MYEPKMIWWQRVAEKVESDNASVSSSRVDFEVKNDFDWLPSKHLNAMHAVLVSFLLDTPDSKCASSSNTPNGVQIFRLLPARIRRLLTWYSRGIVSTLFSFWCLTSIFFFFFFSFLKILDIRHSTIFLFHIKKIKFILLDQQFLINIAEMILHDDILLLIFLQEI